MQQSAETTGHITTVKSDKCLLSEIRDLFIGTTLSKDHEHTDRRVYFYPDEVFCVEDKDGEKIFFIPVIPFNGKGTPQKRPIPIFMCNFSGHHKTEIMVYGANNGIEISYKYFSKPEISITYAERLEYEMADEVAVSLIHRPKVIFLDEPTIGLDIVAKKSLRDLLLKINEEEKVTIFLTSHDVSDIESICNRTIIINDGTVVKDLPTTELAKSFLTKKNIDLIPKDVFRNFPTLPDGMEYSLKEKNKLTVTVDINKISVQDSIKKLLDLFETEDIDVYNTGLESIIRHIYESNSASK